MSNSSSSLIGLGFFVLFFGLMMWRRTAAMRRPIKGKGYGMIWPLAILLLPGVMIFANPVQPFQGSWWEILAAVGLGGILSIPMILTTQYEKRDDGLIYAKQSKAFLFAIFGVVLIRLALKEYITGLDPMTLNGLFFLTAFVYLLLWRITSFMKFRRIWQENQES